ncbi:uncharacterized protein LOC106728527 isoform X2 [Camelus ferus]|uniref:Uncharacterized protein LOC106728527 isoform X2 n=1 Tax=Camelus ferus TaxID=419612 RepID=A0A8B8UAJ2_CAMFR|nr:uncharacterized protein LOC106728527 isoform X2 [Camelus ferus]
MGCTGKPGSGGPADRSGACVGATWRRDSDIASCPLAPSAGSECSREGSTEAGGQSRLSAGAPRGEPTRTRVRLGGLMEELPANRRLPTAESIPPGEMVTIYEKNQRNLELNPSTSCAAWGKSLHLSELLSSFSSQMLEEMLAFLRMKFTLKYFQPHTNHPPSRKKWSTEQTI